MLGRESCRIELDVCGEPIGKQDQYAAAYGGLNLIEFLPDESVVVSPIICARDTVARLQSSILMFYTGMVRSASALLSRQQRDIATDKNKEAVLGQMVQLAYQMRDSLRRNDVDSCGEILHENWLMKKSITSGISTAEIDEWYGRARAAGATGGKILGAGAGGFLMVFAPPDRHGAVREALEFLREIPVAFEPQGSRIIFYQ
jgi:D-glycero-alpha-D-manno-heptose-7-phosphate kinase